ncbi:MAG TPA: hypothetical protein VLC98_08420 [Phnomibacter sp.]|nr:hypothetical protein [Phnomibacter sp.]
MKKTMTLLLPLLMAICSMAQPPKGQPGMNKKPPMPGEKNAHMKGLNLSAEQQKQMKDLQANFRTQLKTLDENEAITVKEQRDRRDKLQRQHRKDMENLLTPEQRKQLSNQKASHERMAKLHSDMQVEKMGSKMNLTADQIAQLQASRTKTMTQMKTIRENDSLDRTARQQQMQQLKKHNEAALAKMLNKEQMEQYKQMQKNERHNMMQQRGPHPMQPMYKEKNRGEGPREKHDTPRQPAK